jgi:hypothetical protein
MRILAKFLTVLMAGLFSLPASPQILSERPPTAAEIYKAIGQPLTAPKIFNLNGWEITIRPGNVTFTNIAGQKNKVQLDIQWNILASRPGYPPYHYSSSERAIFIPEKDDGTMYGPIENPQPNRTQF